MPIRGRAVHRRGRRGAPGVGYFGRASYKYCALTPPQATFVNVAGNQTANPVSRLRFRIVDATMGPAAAGTADLRLLSSPDLVVTVSPTNCASPPCMVNLAGLTLEQRATQAAGGGLNSTVAAGTITPGAPLAPGASLSVEFRPGVRQTGAYRFFTTVEALP